jgi:hypothetical protein
MFLGKLHPEARRAEMLAVGCGGRAEGRQAASSQPAGVDGAKNAQWRGQRAGGEVQVATASAGSARLGGSTSCHIVTVRF